MARQFHQIAYDDSDPGLLHTVDYRVGEFDNQQLWTGASLEGPLPEGLKLVARGRPVDWFPNPLSLPICSERLLAFIERRAAAHIQVFDAPLFDESGAPILGYKLLNLTQKLSCLDRKRSQPQWGDLVLTGSRVPPEAHLFRVRSTSSEVICSDALARDLVGQGITGLVFVRLATS
jgi:hypothetical protein